MNVFMIAGRFRFVNCSLKFITDLHFILTRRNKKMSRPLPKKRVRRGCWKCRKNKQVRSDLHGSLFFLFDQMFIICVRSGTSDTVLYIYTRQPIKSSRHFSSSLHCRVVILITIIFSTNTPNFWKYCCCCCFIFPFRLFYWVSCSSSSLKRVVLSLSCIHSVYIYTEYIFDSQFRETETIPSPVQ